MALKSHLLSALESGSLPCDFKENKTLELFKSKTKSWNSENWLCSYLKTYLQRI